MAMRFAFRKNTASKNRYMRHSRVSLDVEHRYEGAGQIEQPKVAPVHDFSGSSAELIGSGFDLRRANQLP
jgi:hypothetical protein